MAFLKIAFLFVAVWFTIINTARAMCKQDLPPANIFVQTVGIVGFIVMQFDLLN